MNNKLKLVVCLMSSLSLMLLPVVFGASCSQCRVGWDFSLKEYYISIEPWDGLLNDSGIPLFDYGDEIGTEYNSAIISQYALANFDLYLETCDSEYRDIFLNQADWLLENLVIGMGGDFYVWEYSFDYAPSDVDVYMEAPWVSAVAQGQGISVLLRAYDLTREEEYLEAAEAVMEAFEKTIDEGGVLYTDGEGFSWYEEYPSSQPSHVLNGFIYALFGLYDMYLATGSEKALGLFNDGVETIKANLQEYDTGSWSLYYLSGERDSITFIFRFKTASRHPQYRHPIDEISLVESLNGAERVLVFLDVGHKDDTTNLSSNNSNLFYDPMWRDWSRSYILDGRTVRNYENYQARVPQASFELRFVVNPEAEYYLTVAYKDISTEPVYVEIYIAGERNFLRLGELEADNSKEWQTSRIEIPQSPLSRGHEAMAKFHQLLIEQLEALHSITGESIFSEYELKFGDYLIN